MKIQITLTLLLFSSFTFAQEVTISEPDFEGQIVYVNSNNETSDLEIQTCSVKSGQSVGRIVSGIGKVKARLVVKGIQSSTILKKSEELNFVYNNGYNNVLPTKVIGLLEFKQTKKNREYLISDSSNVSGQTSSGVLNYIKYKAKKYGQSSYLITLNNLPVGEYAFFLGEEKSNDAYLFSVE